MAKAPRPGVGERTAAARAAQKVMTLTVGGESRNLAVGLVPMSERLAVRAATKMPFEAFLSDEDKIGSDSVLVLWWLARRANGEPGLSWGEIVAQTSVEDLMSAAVDIDEPDGDDPEA